MPHCDCGFDFAKAHLGERRLVSYALIPNENYRAAIRREHAILNEKDANTKLRKIARAASLVGNLVQCPCCGSWLLDEPEGRTGKARAGKDETADLR